MRNSISEANEKSGWWQKSWIWIELDDFDSEIAVPRRKWAME